MQIDSLDLRAEDKLKPVLPSAGNHGSWHELKQTEDPTQDRGRGGAGEWGVGRAVDQPAVLKGLPRNPLMSPGRFFASSSPDQGLRVSHSLTPPLWVHARIINSKPFPGDQDGGLRRFEGRVLHCLPHWSLPAHMAFICRQQLKRTGVLNSSL